MVLVRANYAMATLGLPAPKIPITNEKMWKWKERKEQEKKHKKEYTLQVNPSLTQTQVMDPQTLGLHNSNVQ